MQQNAGPDRAMLVAVKLANGKGRSIRSCEDADPGTPRTFPWGANPLTMAGGLTPFTPGFFCHETTKTESSVRARPLVCTATRKGTDQIACVACPSLTRVVVPIVPGSCHEPSRSVF